MPPRVIGQYQIHSVLGSGGIGCVYRAVDKRTGEPVALKLLSTGPALDPIAARRMAREFEALYELSHPNIVKVFDTGVYRGYPYLAMELIEGLTLREYLELHADDASSSHPHHQLEKSLDPDSSSADPMLGEDEDPSSSVTERAFDLDRLAEEPNSEPGGPIFGGEHVSGRGPEALRRLADVIDEPFTDDSGEASSYVGRRPEVTPVEQPRPPRPDLELLNRPERVALLKDALLQVCEALAYVHARGMVHRDLKPSNIMVDDDRHVRLMDFGLAKYLAEESAVTAAGRVVGTYRYMAPEQLLGERLDGRADLYSMGVMIYELLAGRPPFDAKTPIEMCQKVLEQDATPLLSLNPGADEALARIAHRLLRKDPSERYQTAEEIYEQLMSE